MISIHLLLKSLAQSPQGVAETSLHWYILWAVLNGTPPPFKAVSFVTHSSSKREEEWQPEVPRIQRKGGATRTFHRSSGIIELHPSHISNRTFDAYCCVDVLPLESTGVGRGKIAFGCRLQKYHLLEQRRSHQPPMLARGSLLSSRLTSPGFATIFCLSSLRFRTASLQPYHSPQLKATKNGEEGGRRLQRARRCGEK